MGSIDMGHILDINSEHVARECSIAPLVKLSLEVLALNCVPFRVGNIQAEIQSYAHLIGSCSIRQPFLHCMTGKFYHFYIVGSL